ncbi:MAG: acyl-CoA dehydrogenase family protein [Acidimicrobiia bacterium]
MALTDARAHVTDRESWLEAARSLSTIVRDHAEETERLGRVAEPVMSAMRDADLFWPMLPPDYGGADTDVVTALLVLEEIARADGSTGWSAMITICNMLPMCGMLPRSGGNAIFAAKARPMFAGVLAPKATAIAVDGGFHVTGRLSFASGIHHADWVGVGAFVRENGKVVSRPDGQPDIRAFFLPFGEVELMGNWDVLGLGGTGSVDFQVTDRFVPSNFCFELPDPPSTRPGPNFQLGLGAVGGSGHGAVGLGIAGRALEEIATLAQTKRRPGNPGICDQQMFKHGFASKEASLQAARRLFFGSYQDAYDEAAATGSVNPLAKQRMRQACTYATDVAADVVRWAYSWSGSDGLRNPHPLGRCLRDISGATQHVFVDLNSMADTAPALLAHWAR